MDELCKKITPKRWRKISIVLYGLMAAFLIVYSLSRSFFWVGAVFLMVVLHILGNLFFWRCPSCGAQLSNQRKFNRTDCCPYCGKDIYE